MPGTDARAEYPLVCALLAELCVLDEADMQLPLPVLVNLHRRALRAPLENLEKLLPETYDEQTRSGLRPMQELMQQRWPVVRGRLYDTSERLVKLASILAWSNIDIYPDVLAGRHASSPLVRRMLENSMQDWYPYETPALLHRLTWAETDMANILPMLEIELGLDPAVRQMLLELAEKDELASTSIACEIRPHNVANHGKDELVLDLQS